MCNLYRMTNTSAEVARLFSANDLAGGGNQGELVFPGYPGMVVTDEGVRTMAWGFPLTMKGKDGRPLKPKPVNNTRADKLDSFMWRYSFAERRCLIPLNAFAEAEGPKGGKTRTWLSLPDKDIFACAGIWRDSPEWGPVYSMVMTEACVAMGSIHDRMPVILRQEQWQTWTDAPVDDAKALCVPWSGELSIDRTAEPWVRR